MAEEETVGGTELLYRVCCSDSGVIDDEGNLWIVIRW